EPPPPPVREAGLGRAPGPPGQGAAVPAPGATVAGSPGPLSPDRRGGCLRTAGAAVSGPPGRLLFPWFRRPGYSDQPVLPQVLQLGAYGQLRGRPQGTVHVRVDMGDH